MRNHTTPRNHSGGTTLPLETIQKEGPQNPRNHTGGGTILPLETMLIMIAIIVIMSDKIKSLVMIIRNATDEESECIKNS